MEFKEPEIINAEFARTYFPIRPENSNKGSFGKVLNIAGCESYAGAAYLSSVAPLKTGAGLVVLASCSNVLSTVSAQTPNVVMSKTNDGAEIFLGSFNNWLERTDFNAFAAISIGCGLGQSDFAILSFEQIVENLKNLDIPIVYDADALNICSNLKITDLGKNAILTPHPGEMSRLMEVSIEEIQANRLFYAQKAVEKYSATVVLKGRNTIIATTDGNVYADNVGSQILAKAGMGDVLVGIISGLCAQGVPSQKAAALGVFIHSNSAECARKKHLEFFAQDDDFAQNASTASLLASELINFIPQGIAVSGMWT